MKVRINQEVYNRSYWPLINNWIKVEVLKGGGSAGKSFFVAQRLIYRLMKLSGYNAMVIRKSQNTNRTSTLPLCEQVIKSWGVEKLFHVSKSLGNEKIVCSNGNEVIFKGLDDVSKLKSTTFKTGPLVYIWVEEADECLMEECLQLEKVRLRGISKYPKQITYSFNPISAEHWLKKVYFDHPSDDVFILETTYKDNQFLTDDDVRGLESLKDIDELQYKVYCLGEWGSRDGVNIFTNIKVHDFDIGKDMSVLQGMDFGWNDPNVLVQCYIDDDELWIYDEIVKSGVNINNFIEMFLDKSDAMENVITADNSGKGDIDILREAGYNMSESEKGKGSIYDGIMFLKTFKAINIHKSNCPVAAREFPNYRWRQVKKEGNLVTLDEPVDKDNHTIDAVRYAIEDIRLSRQLKPLDFDIRTMGL